MTSSSVQITFVYAEDMRGRYVELWLQILVEQYSHGQLLAQQK